MKNHRLLLFLTALLSAFSLVLTACGQQPGAEVNPNTQPTPTSAQTPDAETTPDGSDEPTTPPQGTGADQEPQGNENLTGDAVTDYFSQKLAQISPDTPLVITQRQTFDWNGLAVTAATASNIVAIDHETKLLWADGSYPQPNPPEGENTVMYLMSALFVDGHEPIDLMPDEVQTISKTPLGEDALGVSYDCGEQAVFMQFLRVIQYESGDMLTSCPVFCDHTGELTIRNYKYHPTYSLEDADGDGEPEFVFFRDRPSSLYAKYAVYDWEGGAVRRTTDVLERYRNPMESDSQAPPRTDGVGPEAAPEQNTAALAACLPVLRGETGFIYVQTGERVLLEQLQQVLYDGREEARVKPTHFAVADLDADGVSEVVVRLSVYSTWEYLILHYREGEVYGCSVVLRGLMELKADGTFDWSSGAFDNGSGRLCFEGYLYTYGNHTVRKTHRTEKITWCQSGGHDEDGNWVEYFFVEGQPATAQEYTAARELQRAKPDAEWYEFTQENLAAQLAGQEG